VVPRRTVVLLANCNKCHDKLQLHGGNRNTVESCLVCHNPTLTGGSNPAGTSESLSLQYMVHKIHTGEELENDYFIGTSTNFKEVLYPGDRRNCNACHDGDTFTAPLPGGNAPVLTPKNFWSPSMPTATACMSCHDSASTAAHVFLNTATFGTTQVEACAVCHKESADFAVTKAHAR
jgi:OmcA/MtrC family decaheme c-type cytochrome